MDLKVIGAGFGCTGTLSLKAALEMLGFAPCYHMLEVRVHPGHARLWDAALRGESLDWEALMGGYKAAVDWPACYFWRELLAMNPGAKVILTEREPELWYKSISSTIFEIVNRDDGAVTDPDVLARSAMVRHLINDKQFGGDLSKAHVLDVYRKNGEAVRREVPADQLLVFDPAQGWGPLCAFLGVAVPEAAYPMTNTTEEFRNRAQIRPAAGT